MKYAHLRQAFYGEPWHLRPDYWRNFEPLLQRALAGHEVSPVLPRPERQKSLTTSLMTPLRTFLIESSAPLAKSECPIVGPTITDEETGEVYPLIPQMEIFGPLAIIPVQGVLGRHLSRLDLICGGVDYEHIATFCQLAAAEPTVTDVVFQMDSPGGMSAGCLECAAAIDSLGTLKRTYTYTESVCCSAAYWLAARTHDILAAPTAQVGNVGTIICGEDNSAQWAQQGRKVELFCSSPLKATGADGKPWTDADRAYLEERMLQCDARIKTAVLTGRAGRIDPASLDGRYFYADIAANAPGSSGLTVGMVDEIASTLDEALSLIMLGMSAARI